MLEYLDYDANGKKTVCEIGGFHADMGMNIFVYKMNAGDSVSVLEEKLETAILLLSGETVFEWAGSAPASAPIPSIKPLIACTSAKGPALPSARSKTARS